MAASETNTNVARFLTSAAEQSPEAPAVKLPRRRGGRLAYRTVSFRQLEQSANAAAAYLHDRGIVRGTRVLLMVKPGYDLILTVFALFKIGAIPVVIDPGMGWKHFRNCVRQSRPEALVGIRAAIWLSPLLLRGYCFQQRVCVGDAGWRRVLANSAAVFEPAVTGPADLAAVLFTSGSTGPAKGVPYEHGMFDAQVRLLRAGYRISPGEVDLTLLPVFALFNPAMGMTTVVPEMNPARPAQADPARIVETIRQADVTNSFGSPALWAKLVRYCEATGQTLSSIRRIQIAGAPVPPDLIRRLKAVIPNGEVNTPYGATESLPVSTISGSEILAETQALTDAGRGTCVGALFPEIKARIILVTDEPIETLSDEILVPDGEIGELVVAGPVVTKTYDARSDATAAAKLRDPHDPEKTWHRMGDIGYRDDKGRIWFCGRKAERVRTADGDMFTDCSEAIFNRHPAVFRSALIGLGEPGQQTPAIVIEPEPGQFPADEKAKADFTEELLTLGAYHEHTRGITTVFFKEHFPVDVRHNAKIHRLALAREFSAYRLVSAL